jgi:hypothetical protein
VEPSPLTGLVYQPWMIDGDDCGAIGGMMSGRGIQSTRREVRLEVFMAVTMQNGVFWDVMPCGSCKSPRFGET